MAQIARYLGIGVSALGILMLLTATLRFAIWGQVEVNGFLIGLGLTWLGWIMVLIVEEEDKYR